MRYFLLATFLAVLAIISIAGLRGTKSPHRPLEFFPDMRHQPKVKAQKPSEFFADGSASRMPVPGTVAMQMPAREDYRASGKFGNMWGDGMPVAIDQAAMARGRERFEINCQVCHGAAGQGNGITTRYGLNGVANFHIDRMRQMADGEIFNTITNGKGLMNGYGANISIDDRWKIIAYVRALQRSEYTPLAEAPPEIRERLAAQNTSPGAKK
jgi:mono/diheme cytochrome c family protein